VLGNLLEAHSENRPASRGSLTGSGSRFAAQERCWSSMTGGIRVAMLARLRTGRPV